MAKKPKSKPDDKEQSRRFVETANSLGISESDKSFQLAVGKIIKKRSYSPSSDSCNKPKSQTLAQKVRKVSPVK